MTVRSSSLTRWQDMWRLSIPRSRLGLNVTRHTLFLAAAAYVAVLILVYLHLLGQIAYLETQTEVLQKEWRLQVEQNAYLESQIATALSVQHLADVARGLEATASTVPFSTGATGRAVSHFAQTQPEEAAPPTTSHVQAWLEWFHIPGNRTR